MVHYSGHVMSKNNPIYDSTLLNVKITIVIKFSQASEKVQVLGNHIFLGPTS
jgi:hypothetical protein